MAIHTEPNWPGEAFVQFEEHSFKQFTALSGQVLVANQVVAKVLLGGIGGLVAVLSGSSPGNGTMTNIYAGPNVEAGDYLVQCTAVAAHGGTFSVTTPGGVRLEDIVMTGGSGAATNYRSSHINFTLTDGSSDFTLTALFTVTQSATAPVVVGGTGTGTISLISYGPDSKPGRYRAILRAVVANGGDFEVLDPDDESVGRFIMGTGSGASAAFTSDQINFTLTDATDFIVGNYFDIAAAGGSEKIVAWDPSPATFDGRNRVAGVLRYAVDATTGDTPCVVCVWHAIVNRSKLAYAAGTSAADKRIAEDALESELHIRVAEAA